MARALHAHYAAPPAIFERAILFSYAYATSCQITIQYICLLLVCLLLRHAVCFFFFFRYFAARCMSVTRYDIRYADDYARLRLMLIRLPDEAPYAAA